MFAWVLRLTSICFLVFYGSLMIRIWWAGNFDPKHLAGVLINMVVALWVMILVHLLLDRMRGRKYLVLLGLIVSGFVVEAACRVIF